MRTVFVHLGERGARHLWLNLRRHSTLFPHIPASIVVSSDKHLGKIPQSVDVIKYRRSASTESSLKALELNANFRGGFWHFSLERLIALSLAHDKYPDTPILHVESDVLLLPSIPWDVLAKEVKLMWGKADDSEDIGALIYSPHSKATSRMVSLVEEAMRLDPKTSDMRALRFAAQSLRSDEFRYLPFSFQEPALEGGIFDVLAFGMWLGGMDPSNARGIQTFHISMPHHIVQAGEYKYQLSKGDLYAFSAENESRRIFSIHVHSKDLRIFGADWLRELSRWVELSSNSIPIKRFVIRGFVGWITELFREVFSKKGFQAMARRFSTLLRIVK